MGQEQHLACVLLPTTHMAAAWTQLHSSEHFTEQLLKTSLTLIFPTHSLDLVLVWGPLLVSEKA